MCIFRIHVINLTITLAITLQRSAPPLIATSFLIPAMVAARGPPPSPALPPHKRSTNYGYYIPMDGGGSMLTVRSLSFPYKG